MALLTLDLSIFSLQTVGGISVVWGEYLSSLLPYAHRCGLPMKMLLPPNSNHVASELGTLLDGAEPIGAVGRLTKFLPSSYVGTQDEILHMSYYRLYPFFKGRKVVTVHDFIHTFYSHALQRTVHETLKWKAVRSADMIICVSESTKADLLRLAPDVPAHRVLVIPNSAGEDFYPSLTPRPSELVSPFLLWVGKRSGYKNFESGLRFLYEARQHSEGIVLRLVGSPLDEREKTEVKRLGLEDAIIVESVVSTERLRDLYSNAVALLYLSLYEGFGIPILEAQRCGCPVVCSPTPVSKEVAKDSAIYLHTNNSESVANILEQLAEPSRREVLVSTGRENAERYSWDNSARALIECYQSLGWSATISAKVI